MADRRTVFSEEEERKFQDFFDVAERDDVELEDQFDLFDQYFPTPEEAGAYNDWHRLNKKEKPNVPVAESRPASPIPRTIKAAPLETYQGQLANANFSNIDAVAGLNDLMNCGFHPHIPIGYVQDQEDVAFRLVPNTTLLTPTKAINWKHGTDKTVAPPMILGINHTVILHGPKVYGQDEYDATQRYIDDSDSHSSDDEDFDDQKSCGEIHAELVAKVERFSTPGNKYGKYGKSNKTEPSPHSSPDIDYTSSSAWEGITVPLPEASAAHRARDHKQIQSDESTRTGDSDTPNDKTGFVFYQLGRLQYCESLPDISTTDKGVIFGKDWHRTEYVLVAQIEWTGKLGAIWVLWDFWAEDDDDRKPIWAPPYLKFPGTKRLISGAKIANSFADLGPTHKIQIPHEEDLCLTNDFELVACFRLPNEGNRIVRQWVVDPSAHQRDSSA